jgi:hypothetical protein
MKRVLITALILTMGFGLVGAFAEGQTEDPSTEFGRGWRDERPALEEVTLTGKVYFQGMDFPVLKTAEGEYDLMVPRYYTYDIEIEEGQTITVEGFLGPDEAPMGRFSRSEDGEPHVMVTKAIIGGEEFEIDTRYGSMMSGDFDPRGAERGGQRGAERGGSRGNSRGGRMGHMSRPAPKGGRW